MYFYCSFIFYENLQNSNFAVFVVKCCHMKMCLCEGAEGFSTQEDQELLSRIEKQLKRRFVIGSQVSEHAIVQDFTRQVDLLSVIT